MKEYVILFSGHFLFFLKIFHRLRKFLSTLSYNGIFVCMCIQYDGYICGILGWCWWSRLFWCLFCRNKWESQRLVLLGIFGWVELDVMYWCVINYFSNALNMMRIFLINIVKSEMLIFNSCEERIHLKCMPCSFLVYVLYRFIPTLLLFIFQCEGVKVKIHIASSMMR